SVFFSKESSLWFAAAATEQLERTQSYSSCFGGASPFHTWLCEQPIALQEMHRRKTLTAARVGMNPIVPNCLRSDTPRYLNADIGAAANCRACALRSKRMAWSRRLAIKRCSS
ncbi:MAG TPA: hypothetical protein VGF02_14375, partial [Pseudolabrys sp.]